MNERTPSEKLAWFHSAGHEDESWRGPCASREEALEQGRLDANGAPFMICTGHRPRPVDMFMPADRLLEDANERANDECETDWPELPKGGMALFRAEYEAVIRKWFPECPFWVLDGGIEEIRPHKEAADG